MNAPYHNKALPTGTLLREWRLEEVLGVGGFGIVYRGKDVYFGETVAIKEYFPGAISDRLDGTTVAPTDSSSEEIYDLGRRKFLEEAKVLWNLSHPERHPNIVSVRSLFEVHGTAYMVMDFENGLSLSQMLREGKKFDAKGLMALIRPIAEGLARAHAAGVLHRDIKPANILINQSGRPVLIDFGSARFDSGQTTQTKVTFYTPPYAALEQYVKSYPQGPWTDIYALGVVMYQCIAGEKPAEVLERLHGGVGQPLSARQWPDFSRAFTRAVDAAMAIRPTERPATIADWLRLFDVADEPDDEATRIGTPMPSPHDNVSPVTPPVAAEAPARVVAEPVALPVAPPVAAEAPVPPTVAAELMKRRRLTQLVMGSVAAAVLLGGVTFFSLHRSAPATAPAEVIPAAPVDATSSIAEPIPAAPVTAAPATPAQPNLADRLGQKWDAVIDAATKAKRPQSEVASLSDAKTKLVALIASDKPQDANIAARQLYQDEAASLGRAEQELRSSIGATPDSKSAPEAAQSIAALAAAKTGLDAALTKDPSKWDAAQAADSTRQALASLSALQDAYAVAIPVFATAKRKQFSDLYVQAQSVAGQVATLAKVEKPWFLASRARKDAYQTRQDNEARAKTVMAPLDTLAPTLAEVTDLRQLDTAITQLTDAKKILDDLAAASNAAPV